MLLAGDIGGTKTHLAIFSSPEEIRKPVMEATLPSARYPSLEALVKEFLSQVKLPIQRASFGVAGPVIDGSAKITNLPWIMDERDLARELQIEHVDLLNDLAAMAHAVPFLEASDLHTINNVEAVKHGTLAVIAPGTGLGEAFLTWKGEKYITHPSEGGHADFAPTNDFQLDMLRFLLRRLSHVSYEHVCSGIGLPNIYDYVRDTAPELELGWVNEQLAAVRDATPAIVRAALDPERPSSICIKTLKTFISILGAEAGNLALKVLATGGVYVGGGIPTHMLSMFNGSEFMDGFTHKGRFKDLLSHIPVHIVLNPNFALLGAAYEGFDM